MERQTVGLMLPPAARTAPRLELSQQGSDTSLATSNLLRKRNQQIQRIDIAERPDKRPRANGQFRPPTPFPLEFVDCTRLLIAGDGGDMVTSTTTTTTTTSSSPAPLSSDFVNSGTRYMPPPQLSEVINALTCLQESIALLSTKPGGPTPHELADLANDSCESIVRDLRVVMATHADLVMRAEQHAREQLRAETVAFLHVSEH